MCYYYSSHFESCLELFREQQPPVGILFFCPKPLFEQNSTMATSLAAGRAPRPRARPPRRPRHQAPPRGRAGTRAAPRRHFPGQNNKDQNSDQNSQNRIRTKIATRKRTRWRKTTRGGHRGRGVPAGWPNRHGAKNSARRRFTSSPPSVQKIRSCQKVFMFRCQSGSDHPRGLPWGRKI